MSSIPRITNKTASYDTFDDCIIQTILLELDNNQHNFWDVGLWQRLVSLNIVTPPWLIKQMKKAHFNPTESINLKNA
jgi:hypothetical protein